jgi:hypothetical protein
VDGRRGSTSNRRGRQSRQVQPRCTDRRARCCRRKPVLPKHSGTCSREDVVGGNLRRREVAVGASTGWVEMKQSWLFEIALRRTGTRFRFHLRHRQSRRNLRRNHRLRRSDRRLPKQSAPPVPQWKAPAPPALRRFRQQEATASSTTLRPLATRHIRFVADAADPRNRSFSSGASSTEQARNPAHASRNSSRPARSSGSGIEITIARGLQCGASRITSGRSPGSVRTWRKPGRGSRGVSHLHVWHEPRKGLGHHATRERPFTKSLAES